MGATDAWALGLVVALMGVVMLWLGFWIHADDLKADFEEQLGSILSPALGSFCVAFSAFFSKAIGGEWERYVDQIVFPEGTQWDCKMLAFVKDIYPVGGINTPRAIYERSEVARAVSLDEFEAFHQARREISRFLQVWAMRTRKRKFLKEYVHRRLVDDSTKRVVKASTYTEIALASSLANPTAPLDRQEWYEWAKTWYKDD